jgi:ribosomal-protein-alanine N-acetyltransferase
MIKWIRGSGMWRVEEITKEYAEIISCWQCAPPYEMYSMDGSQGVQQELLEQLYFVVLDSHHIVGYFCLGEAAQVPAGRDTGMYKDDLTDIGIGMRPDVTGNRLGKEFFSFVLMHAKEALGIQSFRLTVAAFNKRAIKLYETYGFQTMGSFYRNDMKFYVMKRI